MAAGDAVVKGSAEFTEQKPSKRWQRGRGWRKVREWQGPFDATKITTLIATIQAAYGEDIDIQEGWPTVVTASFPYLDTPPAMDLTLVADADGGVSEWTLDPYDLTKALASHGKFNASAASPGALVAIEADIKSAAAYGRDYETEYPSLGEFNEYVLLRGQGTDSYLSFGYVLRRVTTYERGAQAVRTRQQNAPAQGKVLTWDQIEVPREAYIERPWIHLYAASIWTSLKYKNGSAGSWADVYVDEWLAKPMGIRFTREGRLRKHQIVQEYLGACNWSATLYDGGKGTP